MDETPIDPTLSRRMHAPEVLFSRLLQPLRHAIDRFVPTEALSDRLLDLKRARVIVGFTLVTAPLGLVAVVFSTLMGDSDVGVALFIATTAAFATPFILRRTAAVTFCGIWLSLQLYWALVATSWLTGGAMSPVSFWLGSVPLFAAILAGRGPAYAMAVLCAITYLTMWVLDGVGLGPPTALPPEKFRLIHLAAVSGLALLTVPLALWYQSVNNSVVARLRAANVHLRAEIDQHFRTRQSLVELNQELIRQARLVGRAEIATNVLHNVGNALNRVNLLAEEVTEGVSQSRIPKLAKAVAMLEENREHLASAFPDPDQGKKLLDYLTQVSAHLQEEHERMTHRFQELVGSLDHLKVTVSTQQGYAQRSLFTEVVSLEQAVDEANRFVFLLGSSDIQVETEVEDIPPLVLDRHRLMEIIVNLLGNARDAVRDSGNPDKRIRLRVRRGDAGRAVIEVSDNGIGLPPGEPDRVFQHGFTTKPDGHGFGLHASAIAAEEMGGTLRCESDGPGRGAVFTLDIPLELAADATPSRFGKREPYVSERGSPS
ncbi:MAG: GHKL domain-containing protein [Deltaproteobacteria bacterium]|nr:GHKL domain-containing protein [Deltaproteobacteria bacterium]